MTRRQLLLAVTVGVAGLLAGGALVRLVAPPPPPGGADPAPSSAKSAASASAGAPPATPPSDAAANDPTPADPSARPAPPPAPDTPPATPQQVARWQAEEPVALHAARDAHRWLDVADLLRDAGQRELEIRARTCAARLERSLQPQTDDEVRDTLVVEVDLLRELSFLARDDWHDDDLLALLQDIEMGAHHALQGAPPPEALDEAFDDAGLPAQP